MVDPICDFIFLTDACGSICSTSPNTIYHEWTTKHSTTVILAVMYENVQSLSPAGCVTAATVLNDGCFFLSGMLLFM